MGNERSIRCVLATGSWGSASAGGSLRALLANRAQQRHAQAPLNCPTCRCHPALTRSCSCSRSNCSGSWCLNSTTPAWQGAGGANIRSHSTNVCPHRQMLAERPHAGRMCGRHTPAKTAERWHPPARLLRRTDTCGWTGIAQGYLQQPRLSISSSPPPWQGWLYLKRLEALTACAPSTLRWATGDQLVGHTW